PPRTRELPARQPLLDQNRVSLYRHQRCLRASARPSRHGPPRHSGGRAAVVFVGAIVHNLGNLTAPTTSTDTNEKINSSSAALLTPHTTFIGIRNAAQQWRTASAPARTPASPICPRSRSRSTKPGAWPRPSPVTCCAGC